MCVQYQSRCTFLCLQYIYLHYHICVLRSEFGHVWLVSFGLFTEIAVCKFLRGWQSYGPKPFYFVHCMCLYICLQLSVRRIVPQIWLGVMHHRNVHYYYYYINN